MQIVSKYLNLLHSIPTLIEISGYRNDYLAKKLNMKSVTFSAKKQRGNWQPDEVENLMRLINNEDVENYLLVQEMEDLKNDEVMTIEAFRKEHKL